ncbi:MAG: hypothetical protein ABSG35_17690, partial [Syntrophobacteraceae bacterium]
LGIAPDFETDLVAKIEQNRRRSWATSRILRLRSGQSRPKAGCERKGFIYGQALNRVSESSLRDFCNVIRKSNKHHPIFYAPKQDIVFGGINLDFSK